MNFRKYICNIFVTLLFDDQKFHDPQATMLKKHVAPTQCSILAKKKKKKEKKLLAHVHVTSKCYIHII